MSTSSTAPWEFSLGGIVGKLSFDRDVRIAPATVQRMLDAVAHRGAGGAALSRSTYLANGIALGSSDGTGACRCHDSIDRMRPVAAIADGDLSNTASLRKSLQERGHVIRSAAAAELIAHAYVEWGDACVQHFAGAFACAIWDDAQRRLVLARDRFGIKPLVFALLHGDGVIFGSGIKALLADPALGREWHPEAIDTYLALGFVPAPFTIYRRVTKLEPGHTLVIDGRRLTTRRYRAASHVSIGASERESIDLLEASLRASVEALSADSSAGVLMSGGVASTAIAAMLAPGATGVAVGIEPSVPDLDRIAGAAAHLGLSQEIDLATIDGVELASVLAASFDEPAADPAAVSQYAVFAAARRHLDVAMTGHGAAALGGDRRPRVLFDDILRHGLYTRRFSWQVREADPLNGVLALDQPTCVVAADLATTDRVAAAAGLRVRHPFLAAGVADFVMASGTRTRDVLRQLIGRYVPAHLVPRHRPAIEDSWLGRAVASLVPTLLLGERFDARGLFSRTAIRALCDEHQSRRRDHTHRLWAVLMLELWFREFIDGDAAALPAEYAVLVRAA